MMISEPEPEQRTERSVHNFIDSHLRELKVCSRVLYLDLDPETGLDIYCNALCTF